MSHELRFARLIDAPPENVFVAFTEPGGQEAFYGRDDPGWIVRSECDLRVGGMWTVEFGPSPRELYRHEHVFEVIDAPRRLVLATTETRLDGSSFVIELEFAFAEEDGKTRMTMIHTGFPSAELRDEHRIGLPNAFARLEQVVAGRPQTRREDAVSATVLYMSMSLDGFIAAPNDGPGNGLGDGGHRLHDWMFGGQPVEPSGVPGRPSGVNGEVFGELMATGAVVVGRRTFELAGGWAGDHHDGVPIFVLGRQEPDSETGRWPLATYVSDVRTAMTRAKQAAGDKNVLVHGAATAQLALAAGVLDELEIHLVPVLLGQGRRLFDHPDSVQIELERTRVIEGPGVTHLHYRVTGRKQDV